MIAGKGYMDYIIAGGITVLLILSVFIIIKIPGLWNKILASNIASTLVIISIVLAAVVTDISMYLDVAVAVALLGFIGTQLFARFLSGKGRF